MKQIFNYLFVNKELIPNILLFITITIIIIITIYIVNKELKK